MSTAAKKKVAKPGKQKAKGHKKLLELEAGDCRWPIGEPRHPDFHFCGAQRADGRPYCELHWAMAFQPPKPRVRTPAALPAAAAVALPAPAKAA
jgi:hypothetical protein